MRFRLVIKSGVKEIASLDGKEINVDQISVGDLGRVIEMEQFLERLFGLRFHIQSEYGTGPWATIPRETT